MRLSTISANRAAAALCLPAETSLPWLMPESHFLESWSDTRAGDGTVSIVQPLISPLYESKTAHELIAALLGNPDAASHDIVYDYWRHQHEAAKTAGSFDHVWQKTLH